MPPSARRYVDYNSRTFAANLGYKLQVSPCLVVGIAVVTAGMQMNDGGSCVIAFLGIINDLPGVKWHMGEPSLLGTIPVIAALIMSFRPVSN